MSSPPEHHDSRHPSFKQYVMIAIILFVITAVEFLIIVPQGWKGSSVVIAPLVFLSVLKFAIVVMFYMHLRFDSRTFSIVFVAGLVLAVLVGSAVLGLFGSFQPKQRPFAAAHAVPFSHDAEASGHGAGPSGPPATHEPPDGGEGPVNEPPDGPSGGMELVAQGQQIFTSTGGCNACHTVQGVSSGLVGPDLSHIGTDGAERKPGVSARDYIAESIRSPEAFVAPDVERATAGIMTSAITANLSNQQVQALVEFLLAQK